MLIAFLIVYILGPDDLGTNIVFLPGSACILVVVKSSHFQENLMLKEQIEALIKEKNSFKNAFRIQHERFADYEVKNQELQHLKQLVSQYQEQIRTLEV